MILPDKPLSVKPEIVISGRGGALLTCDGPHRPKGNACLLFNHYCRYPGLLGLGCGAYAVRSRQHGMPDLTDSRMMCGIVWSRLLLPLAIEMRRSRWPCSSVGSGP